MENNGNNRKGKSGRPLKTDKVSYRTSVNFTDQEHARFLTLFEQSGLQSKALFIKARVFDRPFRVMKTDRGTLEYVAKLSTFHAQYRAIGVNYNQVVKEIHTHFSQKKAVALLNKLEKLTGELVAVGQQILDISEEFNKRW